MRHIIPPNPSGYTYTRTTARKTRPRYLFVSTPPATRHQRKLAGIKGSTYRRPS